jgi:hypothetical protein
VAKINDADPYFEDWDAPDDPNWEAELLSRAAARGQNFERLVDEVIGKIAWDKRNRDPVRLWLIVCVELFEQRKIVQANVREWCVKVSKRAASLAKLLERQPFPPGSPQSKFGFLYERDGQFVFELPSANDVAHLRMMAEAAEVMARGYRNVGAARRHDREALIEALANGFERLTSRRATATNLSGVVTDVLAFEGEGRTTDTVVGAVKRVLKTRRRIRMG